MTSRLLIEAGTAATISQWNMFYQPGVNEDIVSISDLGYRPVLWLGDHLSRPPELSQSIHAARLASYVTGSHNFKTGFQNELPMTSTLYHANGNRNYYFFNGAPLLIAQWATPYIATLEDQVRPRLLRAGPVDRSNKLTVNVGLRWDGFNGYTPEQQANGPGQTADWPGDVTAQNEWLAPRTLRGSRISRTGRIGARDGRRLRPLRQRKNGRQGAARALRFEAGHRPHRGPEPDRHVGDLGHPQLERPCLRRGRSAKRQLRARLRSRELRDQRRVRRHQQRQLRPEQPERDRLRSRRAERLRQAGRELGLLDRNPARAPARLRCHRRLLLQQRRVYPPGRQPQARHR